MKTTITKLLATIAIILASIFSVTQIAPVYAKKDAEPEKPTDSICDSDIAPEIKKANGCPEYATGNKLPSAITIILNSIIGVSGLIAVVFVVIGGINYMTSTGDPGKTKKAKDTILYACIGIIICALAFAIVNWVILGVLSGNSGDDQQQPEEEKWEKIDYEQEDCEKHQERTPKVKWENGACWQRQ